MRREAWGVSLLTLLTIVLAVVITTSRPPPIIGSPRVDSASTTVTPDSPAPPRPTGQRTVSPTPESAQSKVPLALWVLFAIPLVIAAALLVWLVLGGRERRRRRRLATPPFTPSDLDALDVDLEQRLTDVVQAQLADLSTGVPRNAVVAAWLALEEAASDIGFYRKPALTSAEFTEQVLAAYRLDDAAIRRLSSLYREARFSGHEITEQHRRAAGEALNTLRAELSVRARDRLRADSPS